jgi:hypothetical protein
VLPAGHSDTPSGQTTPFTGVAGVFGNHGNDSVPLLQVPAAVSQVVPWGQQWVWSEQQTAWRRGQQPYLPDARRQQVLPSGQVPCLSGQRTLPAKPLTSVMDLTGNDVGVAKIFLIKGSDFNPFMHWPDEASHV